MPIPDFEILMLPVLRLTSDGAEHSMAEMRERIAAAFRLTPEDLAEKQKSGSGMFANRLAWAVVYHKRAELLAPAGRGVYRIADRGKALLKENPPEIKTKTLLVWFHKPGSAHGIDSAPLKEQQRALTPDEQIERSYLDLRDALAHDVLEAVKKISPKAFERVVVEVLVAMGYGGALEDAGQVVGKSGDGGIDGTIKQDKLGLDIVYIQAKRWQDNVGSPEVMGFCGGLAAHHGTKGVMITTSQFSKDAQEYVRKISQKIVLIGGKQLAELMIDHNVGVAPLPRKSYTLRRLDQDYFESLEV